MRAQVKQAIRIALLSLVALTLVACQAASQPAPTQAPPKPTAAPQPAAPQATAAQPATPQPTAAPVPTKPAVVAAQFPTRPIELLVPYDPGGGSAITGETIAKIAKDESLSPQPITVSYKPGASGQIGWAYVAGKKGDAHIITTGVSAWLLGQIDGTSQLKAEDFTPIALIALDSQMTVTRVDSAFKSIKDVVDASKKSPKSVKVAVTGATGADATCATMIELGSGIQLNKIPFNSTGASTAAVLGDQVDLAQGNPNELMQHVEAGKLRVLGVYTEERLPFLKDVPTMIEQGYKNAAYNSWRGVFAPAGIAKNEEEWHINLMRKITQSKQWAEYADKNKMVVKYLGGPDFAKFLTSERTRLEEVLKAMGAIKTK